MASPRGAVAEPAVAATPVDQFAEIQRSRLLVGAVAAFEEFGYGSASVAQITARARVSRRTFYELFASREECLIAVIDDTAVRVERELTAAFPPDLPWRERVRGGLAAILAFLDREPTLARVCVVEALRGGPQVLAHREQLLNRLAGVLDEGRAEGAQGQQCTALTAEALVGAAIGVIHARLLREHPEPLSELYGELIGVILLPYLGAASARRERVRNRPAVPAVAAREPRRASAESDPLAQVPMRLTYRTARVLRCIAEHPGVSNREVAAWSGVSDQGQISKLLARLERLELILNAGEGQTRGERNAWLLTPLGERVAGRLALDAQAARAA